MAAIVFYSIEPLMIMPAVKRRATTTTKSRLPPHFVKERTKERKEEKTGKEKQKKEIIPLVVRSLKCKNHNVQTCGTGSPNSLLFNTYLC
jgi:hypothetical protein